MNLPKPTGEFEWTQESWGPALRCKSLSEIAPHCFSTRALHLPGLREESLVGWTDLAVAVGMDARTASIVRLRQVHGTNAFAVLRPTTTEAAFDRWPEADIAIGRDPSVVLTVRAADCVPVLFADRETGAVAAIHAGWRGTAAGAVQSAVNALATNYSSRPENIVAAVGPSIGPCCYAVGDELMPRFSAHPAGSRWFTRKDGVLRLDLWDATRDQLESAGVAPQNVHVCRLCTSDHPDLFHSYRRDGERAGRLVAAIRASSLAKTSRDTTP